MTKKEFRHLLLPKEIMGSDKSLLLHCRRRKWQNTDTGAIVSNTFDITAKGTQYSKEFRLF